MSPEIPVEDLEFTLLAGLYMKAEQMAYDKSL
jgi:hypothetical protein